MTRAALIAWLLTFAEFAGVVVIVASLTLIAVGFAPDLPQQ